MRKTILGLMLSLGFLLPGISRATIEIDSSDPAFASLVLAELELMRNGSRGLVCQVLVERMDKSLANTTIKPITRDERTWHPNDRKGTRSHVVPLDTRVRGAARSTPISVIYYLHPSRVNPNLSLFKLGTFVFELANSMDSNLGTFSGDYRIQERRATFFKNAWKDSLKGELISMSGRVPTRDYQEAKKLNLLTPENAEFFPILDPTSLPPSPVPDQP